MRNIVVLLVLVILLQISRSLFLLCNYLCYSFRFDRGSYGYASSDAYIPTCTITLLKYCESCEIVMYEDFSARVIVIMVLVTTAASASLPLQSTEVAVSKTITLTPVAHVRGNKLFPFHIRFYFFSQDISCFFRP
jgi:hypothetical protein